MMVIMDPERKENLEKYFDDILPADPNEPHPYTRFHLHEIVRHPALGYGIITGTRIPDLERELEGLGVQFVAGGEMREHQVFTPSECEILESSGFIFDVKRHSGMTLEDVVQQERGDATLPGLR